MSLSKAGQAVIGAGSFAGGAGGVAGLAGRPLEVVAIEAGETDGDRFAIDAGCNAGLAYAYSKSSIQVLMLP